MYFRAKKSTVFDRKKRLIFSKNAWNEITYTVRKRNYTIQLNTNIQGGAETVEEVLV